MVSSICALLQTHCAFLLDLVSSISVSYRDSLASARSSSSFRFMAGIDVVADGNVCPVLIFFSAEEQPRILSFRLAKQAAQYFIVDMMLNV